MAGQTNVMGQWRIDLDLNDQLFQKVIEIPAGMKFVTVLNATAKNLELYRGIVAAQDADYSRDSIITNLAYNNQTVPLPPGTVFTIVARAGGPTSNKVGFIFSTENLQINGPTAQPGNTTNTSIIGDQIGLAKQTQLPGTLIGGNLRVQVMNDINAIVTGEMEVKNDVGNPLQVSGTVNVGNEVEVKNDAGSPLNVAGTVNVGTIPEVEVKNDAGSPLNVAGTVNIGTIPEVEVKNDAGNPLSVNVGNFPATQSAIVEGFGASAFDDALFPVTGAVAQAATNYLTIDQITVPTTATVLAQRNASSSVTLQCPSTNTGIVYFGNSASTCYMELLAGDSVTMTIRNTNMVYVYASAAGQKLNTMVI